MKTTRLESALAVCAVLSVTAALGLGGACSPGPAPGPAQTVAPPTPPPPAPNYSGVYRGPNVLHFAITQPFVRDMPSEEQLGTISVMDGGGPVITVETRMFEGGDACQIQLRREGNRGVVMPGTRCASRLLYEGVPVATMVQIDEGQADFVGNQVQILLRGPFIAEVSMRGRVAQVGGRAVWRFEGVR